MTVPIVAFLLDRIGEDEAAARAALDTSDGQFHVAARLLADCDMKRNAITRYRYAEDAVAAEREVILDYLEPESVAQVLMYTLTDMSRIYADHPDFDPEWGRHEGEGDEVW